MARIRTVKPEFFRDAKLARCSLGARLLAIGLLTVADREGRLFEDCEQLSLDLLPRDDVDLGVLLGELDAARYIVRYEAGGEKLIQIRNFGKHQRPNIKEPTSTIPAPTEHDLDSAGTTLDGCRNDRKGKEGKGRSIDTLRVSHSAIAELSIETAGDVDQVFDYWRHIWRKNGRCRLDAKRKLRIATALKAYGLDDVKAALLGYTYSPHHTGENSSGTVYDDLELHLRDAKHIEAGLQFAKRHAEGVASADMSPRERQEARILGEVMRNA